MTPLSPPIPDRPFDSVDYLAPLVSDLPTARGGQSVLFLAGGPLTGKSSVVSYLLEGQDDLVPQDAVLVDPAAIREQIPEFAAGWAVRDPQATHNVREEAEHIARLLTTRALETGRNLIVHGIGAGAPGAFAGLLTAFLEAGYDVRLLLVDCSTDEALRRNDVRAHEVGLRYDPDELRRLHVLVSRRHLEWRHLQALRWTMYSTEPATQ